MRKHLPEIIIILLVFLFAYLPLNTFLFALKNDMFIGYLPPKYLMGEVLHANDIPLWNPYISFGLPFYGDMSSSYWNPITWFIAGTVGYNPYTLTAEVMLYIVLSGFGMYFLSGIYTQNKYIRLITAIAYMCNGYIVGHLQHINWLSGAAFLPWCIWAYHKMLSNPSLKKTLAAVLAFYFLLSSSHPGIIIGAIYFFVAFALYKLSSTYNPKDKQLFITALKTNTFFLFLLTLLSAGLIMGYSEIIQYFVRSEQIDLSLSTTENTTPASWISILLPFSSIADIGFFKNDIAFRNLYWGLPLLISFISSFFITKTKEQIFLFFCGLFFLLLSAGGIIKAITIKILPLIGFVRINAEFRIFAVICFIIISTITLDKIISEKNDTLRTKLFLKPINLLLSITILASVVGFLMIVLSRKSIFFQLETGDASDIRSSLKMAISSISFFDALFLQGIVQSMFLIAFKTTFNKGAFRNFFYIAAAEIIISTLLNIPYTGVGKVSVEEIAKIQSTAPKGIPPPPIQAIIQNDTIEEKKSKLFGEWSFYNKQIGSKKFILYPIKLKTNVEYFNQVSHDSSLNIAKYPFLFFADSINTPRLHKTNDLYATNLTTYSTNKLTLSFHSDRAGYIVLLQNIYPSWYYETDNNIHPVIQAGTTFIAAPVLKGHNEIAFFFKPQKVFNALIFSFVLFLIYLTLLFFPLKKATTQNI